MPYLLIHHSVQDFHTWKPIYDEHDAIRRANGEQDAHLYRDPAHPNTLTMVFRWDNLERARLFAQSDDLRETMMRAGVIGQPDIWFLDEVI